MPSELRIHVRFAGSERADSRYDYFDGGLRAYHAAAPSRERILHDSVPFGRDDCAQRYGGDPPSDALHGRYRVVQLRIEADHDHRGIVFHSRVERVSMCAGAHYLRGTALLEQRTKAFSHEPLVVQEG